MKRVLYGAAIAAIMAAAPALAFAQSFPAVDAGQASASSHQPSYVAAPMQPVAPQAAPVYWNAGSFPAVNQGQASASAHGPSFGGELSTERSH